MDQVLGALLFPGSFSSPCAAGCSQVPSLQSQNSSILGCRSIKAALGIRRVVISGGGSLVGHLDLFFESIGLPVLNGWGLTETSPVLCCRLPSEDQNIRGTVGLPMPGTEIKVVDPESYKQVEDGIPGLVLARGPGVMKGYHKNPEETARVMLDDGWFSTGHTSSAC